MSMEKRTILAVILSIVVIMTYHLYVAKFVPQPVMPDQTPAAQMAAQGEKAAGQNLLLPASPPPPAKEEETIVETEKFIITFTNIGGAVKKIQLKNYPDPATGAPSEIMRIDENKNGMGVMRDLGVIPGIEQAVFALTRNGGKITYSYENEIARVQKTYDIHNTFNHIELWIKIQNKSNMQITSDYDIIAASSIDKAGAFGARYLEANSKINGKRIKDKKNSIRQGEVSWVALKNKYFSIILKPYQFGKFSFTERIGKDNLLVGLKSAQVTIPAGGEATQQYLIYIGPSEVAKLKAYEMGLEETVDYGIFGGISVVLLNVLRFFHRILRNWGLAIICVTLLINTALYPLTRKSYLSMKQMQELQPHMEKLRTVHKDNPQKLQKEMMELYRTYKVNPLGGCLPLVLQMPIIFAMYQTIMRSIELKGANFLWIKDLSAPDAAPLPFTLPILGNSINILPIIMMIAMVLQQKLSPMARSKNQTEQQKQQQNMMLFMPIMFGVLFYTMPSGLVLYWLGNTVLMVINQSRVMKMAPAITEG